MNVAYITAGAAGMYCGNCLHDNTLAAALKRRGHDVTLVPTYTPIRTDESDESVDRVFYGAINVYLEQKFAVFRHVPRWADRWLAGRRLLDWAGRRAGSTDARALGALTLSVLEGEHGRQRKELDELVTWLRDEIRPDLVHLSNSMLLGLAAPLRRETGARLLCSLGGDDLFLDGLAEPYRERVFAVLRRRVGEVDGLVATSRYYAEFMAGYLGASRERMHTVPLGVKLDGHAAAPVGRAAEPFVVGYLARLAPEKGLHLLAEAVALLAADVGPDRVRLRVAGWLGARDRAYVTGVLDGLRARGLERVVEHVGEVDRPAKLDFLQSLHVLSVPTTYREPKGLFVLEALASGVPVVQPHHGAFPEMLAATGGGLLVEPHSPRALADGLRALMDDPAQRVELGRVGRLAVHRDFGDDAMAARTVALYERVLAGGDDARVHDAAQGRVR